RRLFWKVQDAADEDDDDLRRLGARRRNLELLTRMRWPCRARAFSFRARAISLGGGALVAIATVFACTFPSPDFAPNEAFSGGTFVGLDGGASAKGDGNAASGSSGGNSGTLPDGGCNPCDCDGDGDNNKSCDGGDCDDHDPKIRSTLKEPSHDAPKPPN